MVEDADDIETAEEYQEFYDEEANEGVSRYGHYAGGKAEAAELIIEGEVDSATELNGIAQERYTEAGANTVEAAVAKGMLDATEELADIGALDPADPSVRDSAGPSDDEPDGGDDPSTEPADDDDDEDEEDDADDEDTIGAGGVEVDADEFEAGDEQDE